VGAQKAGFLRLFSGPWKVLQLWNVELGPRFRHELFAYNRGSQKKQLATSRKAGK